MTQTQKKGDVGKRAWRPKTKEEIYASMSAERQLYLLVDDTLFGHSVQVRTNSNNPISLERKNT